MPLYIQQTADNNCTYVFQTSDKIYFDAISIISSDYSIHSDYSFQYKAY